MPTGSNSGHAELLAAATDAVARAHRLAMDLGDCSPVWDLLELAADGVPLADDEGCPL
jgi:hypothetical protein